MSNHLFSIPNVLEDYHLVFWRGTVKDSYGLRMPTSIAALGISTLRLLNNIANAAPHPDLDRRSRNALETLKALEIMSVGTRMSNFLYDVFADLHEDLPEELFGAELKMTAEIHNLILDVLHEVPGSGEERKYIIVADQYDDIFAQRAANISHELARDDSGVYFLAEYRDFKL